MASALEAPRCESCTVRRLALFKPISENELDRIEGTRTGFRVLAPKTEVYAEGGVCHEMFTIYAGWALTAKMLSDGRRQILNFHLPGDFIGLQEDGDDDMDHSAEAVTELALCVFPKARLRALLARESTLANRLLAMATHEGALLQEHLTNVGRRTARERLGHLLLELFTRQRRRGAVTGNACPLPLNQHHLADALGLSVPHVNRTLRELREAGLARIARGRLVILNRRRLARLSDYRENFRAPTEML